MFRNFREIERYIQRKASKKKIALASAQDAIALEAVVHAKRKGIVSAILIGDVSAIKSILMSLGEPAKDYELVACSDEMACAQAAVALVKAGKADMPMKGLMQTATYMRAILDKRDGLLPEGALLSEATVFRYARQNRLMIASDCAINIAPTVTEKVKIVNNAVELAERLGIQMPKVAVISAKEKVTPKIVSTLDAEAMAQMHWSKCIVEGPFALDNALSKEAAEHKGVQGAVAGAADILLMPDLCSGNILHKSLHYFGHIQSASVLCSTEVPVIMTSRTDSPSTKYYSILAATLQAERL